MPERGHDTSVPNREGGGGREPWQQMRSGLLSSQLGNKFTDTGNNFSLTLPIP